MPSMGRTVSLPKLHGLMFMVHGFHVGKYTLRPMDASWGKKHGAFPCEKTTFSQWLGVTSKASEFSKGIRAPKMALTIQVKDENNKLPPELWDPYFLCPKIDCTDWEDGLFGGCFLWKVLRRKIIQLVVARSKLCFFKWQDG